MENWCFRFFLCVAVVVCEELSPLSVKFKPSGILFTEESKPLTFGCEINRNLAEKINVSIIRKSASEESEYTVSKYPESLNIDNNYIGDLHQVQGNGIFIQINISKVTNIDEGKFICRAKNSDGSILEDELHVQIKKPLTNVYLEFDGSDPISETLPEPIEVYAGNYIVACIASGSNPAPTVHLSLNEIEVQNYRSQTLKLDGKLTQYKTTINGTIPIKFSNSIQAIKCDASTQLGVKRSVTVHVKTNKRDPKVHCNETEAYEGQKHVVLTCTLEYEGFNITKFSYSDGKHTVEIPEEHMEYLPDMKIRVSLKLDEAREWHFTDFYLLLSHSDGHVTRQSVKLQKISGGNSASTTILQCSLMSLLVFLASWLILYYN